MVPGIGYGLLEEFIKIMPAEVLMWSWKQHLVEPLLLDAQKPGAQGLVARPEDPGTTVGSAGALVASGGPGHFVCAQLLTEPVLCAKSHAGLSEGILGVWTVCPRKETMAPPCWGKELFRFPSPDQ